ncbi:protein-tyrosine phosphatase-like protein [Chaetomium fimeti]|uniref:Protein-tyrosine phosphatase-like protein n=1 Tax=Chaetomium fimeti TaxID=1854472 RepID=A0AAE0HCK3_9PEZI|nr:protein-tyrosine phosphatase-like protein [Chaetomium fimeti]
MTTHYTIPPIMDNQPQFPIKSTALPTAPYSSRAPSPPYIHVPPPLHPSLANPNNMILTNTNNLPNNPNSNHHPNPNNTTTTAANETRDILMTIHPTPTAVHTTGLSPADLAAVTGGGAPQTARASVWVYEARRAAQPVLAFLYLGPASAAKDRAFLAREGITMVLCARDARFAGGAMLVGGARRAVEGMGIVVEGIDIADGRELVGVFSVAARMVNEHVLGLARQGRKGKVLVVCETGNGRSAAVVAAYLMTMYGLGIVQAVQFMQLQRFCVALGDDFKFQLATYEDILRAKGDVGVMSYQQPQAQQQSGGMGHAGGNVKRRIEQTEEAEGEGSDNMVLEMDNERYASRNFAPFVDRGY